VKEDYDGGFVIAGTKNLTTTLRNAWIIKTDSDGDTLWTTKYGGDRNADAYHISCTSDSGYIVTGRQYVPGHFSDVFLLKLDINGDADWSYTYGGGDYEEGYSVQQTADSGYMVAGSKDMGYGNYNFYLIKTFANGITDWSRLYGGDSYDHCTSAQQTSDGGYILFGESDSYISNTCLAVKTDSLGDTLWTRVYHRSNGDYGWSVDLTTDGGFIFGGYSNNPGYRDDYWFVRTDANGDTLWMKTVGHGDDQRAYCVLQSSDGGYVLAGGSSEGGSIGGDYFVVKLNAQPTAIDDVFPIPLIFTLAQNYPNPFNAATQISYSLPEQARVSLEIFNILGQRVVSLFDGIQPAGEHSLIWDASGQTSGIYFARLKSGGIFKSVKMLLIK